MIVGKGDGRTYQEFLFEKVTRILNKKPISILCIVLLVKGGLTEDTQSSHTGDFFLERNKNDISPPHFKI